MAKTLYRAKITRITNAGLWVEVPKLGIGVEFGPCEMPAYEVKEDDKVLVGQVEGVTEDLVVICTLQGRFIPPFDLTQLFEDVVRHEGEIGALEDVDVTIQTSIGVIQTDLGTLGAALGSLTTRVTATENVNTTQNTNITNLTTRVTTAEGDIDDLETDVAALQTGGESNTTQINALKTRMDTAEDNIDDLETLTASHTSSITTINSTNTTQNTRLTTAEGDIDDLEAADVVIDGRLDTVEADITTYGGRLDDLEDETTGGNLQTAETDWSTTAGSFIKVGRTVSFYFTVTRTGADLTPGADGVVNVDVASLPVGWRPAVTAAAGSAAVGRVAHYRIGTGGVVALGAVGVVSDIVTGETLSVGGTYLI